MIYTPYIWPKLLAAAIPIGFALYMRRFQDVPAARPFSWLMWLASLWAIFHTLNTATIDLPLRLFWGHLQIIPFVLIAPTILALALDYIGQEQWLTRPRRLLLLAIPVITILLAWTSSYHPLYRYNFSMDLSGPVPVLRFSPGPWYWLNLGYTYLLILTAGGLLLTAFPLWTPYFWNSAIITFCILLPFLVSELYSRGITPIPGYNFSATVFVFTGALQLWALLRWRMFDLIPVARQAVLAQMREGIVVLDAQQRIVEVNPAAAQILGGPPAALVGQAFAPERRFPGLDHLTADPAEPLLELAVGPRWYQVSSSPLTGRRGLRPGRLIIWRDITELKQTQTRFVEQQRALAMTAEQVRLARELHDGLGQVLGYVKMRAAVARDLLAQGQTAEVDAYLANLLAVTQEAHTDIREYLLGVNVTAAAEPAFISALQQYLAQFSRNYGLRADLQLSPDLSGLEVGPAAAVQLLRIIQEALTNVRKYAQAERVQVSLARPDNQAQIVIEDDGQGFDPHQPAAAGSAGHTFGLRFMRERAEEMGGTLEVQSAPGQGTRVIIRAPVNTNYEL